MDFRRATFKRGSRNSSSSESSCHTSCLFRYSNDSALAMEPFAYTSLAPKMRSNKLLKWQAVWSGPTARTALPSHTHESLIGKAHMLDHPMHL